MNTNLLTNAERAAYILKAFEPDVVKGGPGSGPHKKGEKAVKEPWMHTFEEHFEMEKPNLPENGKYAEPQARARHKKLIQDALEGKYVYGQKQNKTILDAVNDKTISREQAIKIIESAGLEVPKYLATKKKDIEKGGPGSGRKIGTTTSGKDIYDHFDHPSHKKFGLTDHKDAVTPHAQIAAKLIGKKESKKETFTKEDKAALAHHGEQAKLHFQASKGD
ncbi:MAG TPA: hypothetical protein VK890_03890 [Bacteroidia bacterium]|jgi:hypothetical protein|nr:hypothetical protein [Bacteroidia bacterium]